MCVLASAPLSLLPRSIKRQSDRFFLSHSPNVDSTRARSLALARAQLPLTCSFGVALHFPFADGAHFESHGRADEDHSIQRSERTREVVEKGGRAGDRSLTSARLFLRLSFSLAHRLEIAKACVCVWMYVRERISQTGLAFFPRRRAVVPRV